MCYDARARTPNSFFVRVWASLGKSGQVGGDEQSRNFGIWVDFQHLGKSSVRVFHIYLKAIRKKHKHIHRVFYC